jgi:hypothetical protein
LFGAFEGIGDVVVALGGSGFAFLEDEAATDGVVDGGGEFGTVGGPGGEAHAVGVGGEELVLMEEEFEGEGEVFGRGDEIDGDGFGGLIEQAEEYGSVSAVADAGQG